MNFGPIENIARIFSNNAGPDHAVRTGDFVSVKVLARESGSTWSVSINGKLYSAVTDLALEPGKSFPAQAVWKNGTLHLSVAKPASDAVTTFLGTYGLPRDGASYELARSFLRSGRPLEPDRIERLRKTLRTMKGDTVRNARLLTILDHKGIDVRQLAGADPVSRFFRPGERQSEDQRHAEDGSGQHRGQSDGDADTGAFSGGGRGAGGQGFSHGREKRDENRREQAPPMPLAPARNREADEPEPLARALERAVTARAPASSDSADSPIRLFNHLREGTRHWVVVPVRFDADGTEWTGFIKLLLDDAGKRAVAMSATIDAGGEEWSFSVEERDGGPILKLYAGTEESRRSATRLLPALRSTLGRLGIGFEEPVADPSRFDGFSDRGDDRTIPGVDLLL